MLRNLFSDIENSIGSFVIGMFAGIILGGIVVLVAVAAYNSRGEHIE